MTDFVSYLAKEKGYDTEILSTDRVLNKEHFYGKIIQKMSTISYSHGPIQFWHITQNSHYMREIL